MLGDFSSRPLRDLRPEGIHHGVARYGACICAMLSGPRPRKQQSRPRVCDFAATSRWEMAPNEIRLELVVARYLSNLRKLRHSPADWARKPTHSYHCRRPDTRHGDFDETRSDV